MTSLRGAERRRNLIIIMSKKTWVFTSILFDLAAVNGAIIVAFFIRFSGNPPDFNFNAYTKLALFITVIYFLAAYLSSVYSIEDLLSSSLLEPVFKAITISWVILGAFIWLYRAFTFPRLVFALAWVFAIIFLYAWRFVSLNVLSIDWPKQRVLIVGTKPITKEIISKLKIHAHWGYEIVGIVSDANGRESYAKIPVIGATNQIPDLVSKYSVSRIIITSPLKSAILEQLAALGLQNLRIEVVPDLYEILVGRVDYNTLTDIPLLELTNSDAKSSYKVFKRITDIALATIGLAISFPIVILPASIIIKFTSKGPIFYKQQRIGQNSNSFTLIKLRTMYDNAEISSGPVMAKKKDHRVTAIGRILRKYRLDELPQLVNIIKGEMSFVGPRPERPEFVSEYAREIPGYVSRFKLQPGATGLAQISGSYATDAKNKLKFDLFYLYHRSFLLDLKIIFKTVRVMISGTGSH